MRRCSAARRLVHGRRCSWSLSAAGAGPDRAEPAEPADRVAGRGEPDQRQGRAPRRARSPGCRVERGLLRGRPPGLHRHRAAARMHLGRRHRRRRASGSRRGEHSRRRAHRADRSHQGAGIHREGRCRRRAGDGDGARQPRTLREGAAARGVSRVRRRPRADDDPFCVGRRAARADRRGGHQRQHGAGHAEAEERREGVSRRGAGAAIR